MEYIGDLDPKGMQISLDSNRLAQHLGTSAWG
jgi:hypothetical protein